MGEMDIEAIKRNVRRVSQGKNGYEPRDFPLAFMLDKERLFDKQIPALMDEIASLLARAEAAEARVADLVALSTDARSVLRGVRAMGEGTSMGRPADLDALFDRFWAWAEGWDCDFELRIDAALAGSGDAPARPEEGA